MSRAVSVDAVSGVAAEDGGVAGGWWGAGSGEVGEVVGEGVVDFAGDDAFEAADDVGLAFAFLAAAGGVGLGARAASEAEDGDEVQRAVGLAVTAGVEAVAVSFA